MLFNSINFMIFFPIVTFLYFVIPDRWKKYWLLLSSYYFYMCWNAKYIVLIIFSTVITYVSGLLLERIKGKQYESSVERRYKNYVVAGSVVLNLGVLFWFKYLNFALDLLGKVLARVHIEWNMPVYDIILPVGISFYTFQALSYTMDVYRDEIKAEHNFCSYALFVSFFPQLVAGPIERSKNLLKQMSVPHKFDYERAREGFLMMLWGFFLKIVLADRIALFVDTVYADQAAFPGLFLVVATGAVCHSDLL
ncbi:MAG: MBOAT family O-acyltransferase [Lachnospiraceae bacterium]